MLSHYLWLTILSIILLRWIGLPISVLNLRKSPQYFVNGVYFEVDEEEFDFLVKREGSYESFKVIVESYDDESFKIDVIAFIRENKPMRCFLFNDLSFRLSSEIRIMDFTHDSSV